MRFFFGKREKTDGRRLSGAVKLREWTSLVPGDSFFVSRFSFSLSPALGFWLVAGFSPLSRFSPSPWFAWSPGPPLPSPTAHSLFHRLIILILILLILLTLLLPFCSFFAFFAFFYHSFSSSRF